MVTFKDIQKAIKANDVGKLKKELEETGLKSTGIPVMSVKGLNYLTTILYYAAVAVQKGTIETETVTAMIDYFGNCVDIFAMAHHMLEFDELEGRNGYGVLPERLRDLLDENTFCDEFAELLLDLNPEKYFVLMRYIRYEVNQLDARFAKPLLHFAYRRGVIPKELFFPLMMAALRWPEGMVEAIALPMSLAGLASLLRMRGDLDGEEE